MLKKRIVFDTNILVSVALGNGYCTKILLAFEEGNSFEVYYSHEVVNEYKRVSSYNRIIAKYPLFEVKIINMINQLERRGTKVEVEESFTILHDISDNKFLDLAYACEADYLITGNHLDFTITEFYTTKIVSPKMFWELYQENAL